jgi:hypothetical protein
MRNSQSLPNPAPRWRRYVFALAALSLLGGCGTPNGDFGEVQPYLVSDSVHDWVGPYATGSVPSKFDLTDDERQLRDLSYPLIEPPYLRQQWWSVLGEYGIIRPGRGPDHGIYAKRLLASRYHSPLGRYAQLIDDVRNDVTRMPQFFETAGRVLDMDAKRRKSMAFVSSLPPAERKNAELRMNENASIIALVRNKLAQRVASYRFALERLVIETPSPRAVEAEQSRLRQMQAMIERYRQPAPTWQREQSLVSSR